MSVHFNLRMCLLAQKHVSAIKRTPGDLPKYPRSIFKTLLRSFNFLKNLEKKNQFFFPKKAHNSHTTDSIDQLQQNYSFSRPRSPLNHLKCQKTYSPDFVDTWRYLVHRQRPYRSWEKLNYILMRKVAYGYTHMPLLSAYLAENCLKTLKKRLKMHEKRL